MDLIDRNEATSLVELVATRVRQSTYGQIRNLVVKESKGRVIVSGDVPTRHSKQLALHGALQLLSSEVFAERIRVM